VIDEQTESPNVPDDRLPPQDQPPAPGLFESLMQTVRDARRLCYDHLELAALDAQRAADTAIKILSGAIFVSVLLVTAWMALVAGSAVWAAEAGLSLKAAFFLAALANAVIAGVVGLWIKRHVPDLMFTATLRQLRRTAGEEEWSDEKENRA